MAKSKKRIALAATHTPRLSHNWDFDPDKEKKEDLVLVCAEEDSLFFAPKVAKLATCRGCGAEVPLKLYAGHAARWSDPTLPVSATPVYWIVDKVFNQVVEPCHCRRCEIRRRTLPNYEGLDGERLSSRKSVESPLVAKA